MSDIAAFQPVGPTKSLSVTTTSSFTQAPMACSSLDVRLVNTGSVTAFIQFGTATSAVAVATTGFPLLAGTAEVFRVPSRNENYVAAITASSTATVYITQGNGI